MRSLLLVLGFVVACGGDDDGTGPSGPFACLGDPLPTTAPDAITVSGQVLGNILSPTGIADAEVTAFTSTATELGGDSTDGGGMYSVTVATGGVPLNGYIRVLKGGSSYLPTYAYPAVPLAASAVQNMLVPTGSEIDALEILTGVTQQAGNGFVGVVVKDCAGTPIAGATVSTSPAATVRYNAGSTPSSTATSTAADGVAYVFNVAAGNVTVNARAGSRVLRGHVVNARADAVTLTEVAP